MATPTNQNTSEGGGSETLSLFGNTWLDRAISQAAVGVEYGIGTYERLLSAESRKIDNELRRKNAANPPQQNLPANQAGLVDTLSNPEKVKQLAFVGFGGTLLLVGAIIALRKFT